MAKSLGPKNKHRGEKTHPPRWVENLIIQMENSMFVKDSSLTLPFQTTPMIFSEDAAWRTYQLGKSDSWKFLRTDASPFSAKLAIYLCSAPSLVDSRQERCVFCFKWLFLGGVYQTGVLLFKFIHLYFILFYILFLFFLFLFLNFRLWFIFVYFFLNQCSFFTFYVLFFFSWLSATQPSDLNPPDFRSLNSIDKNLQVWFLA